MIRNATWWGLALLLLASPVAAQLPEITWVRAVFESGASLALEVADEPQERQRGLMYREEVPEGWGMLFVFARPQLLSFWMKNTHAPLSIAFLEDDGTIVNIRKMRPLDTTTRHRSRKPVRLALEVPRGWFEEHDVKPGQRIQLLRKELLVGEPEPRMPGEIMPEGREK
jgi:uncharacterized membrane protein (UPF0127 family)